MCEQFLKLSAGLSLGSGFCVFYCFSFDHFVLLLFGFVVLNLFFFSTRDWLGRTSDLLCVEWDVELSKSLTASHETKLASDDQAITDNTAKYVVITRSMKQQAHLSSPRLYGK